MGRVCGVERRRVARNSWSESPPREVRVEEGIVVFEAGAISLVWICTSDMGLRVGTDAGNVFRRLFESLGSKGWETVVREATFRSLA
jgi:hypothetical protein